MSVCVCGRISECVNVRVSVCMGLFVQWMGCSKCVRAHACARVCACMHACMCMCGMCVGVGVGGV